MDHVLTELTTSISTFKQNPNEAVRNADGQPFAVMTNNKPSFYVVPPGLYEILADVLDDFALSKELEPRLQRLDTAVDVNLAEL